ncbi:CCHC-type domain-containing protein [Pseudoscourfieldia marina]
MSESFPLANYGLPAPNSWQVARITNDLEPKDLIRTQRDVTGLILAAIQEEPEGKAAGTNSLANLRHYDGLRSKYYLWDKAVQRNLATVGLLKLDKLYKNNSLDELQPRHWGQYCSKGDRTLIYNVVMSTFTPEARDTAEREDCNGLMVLNQLWRQWGSPNLNNTIHALRELLSVKVEMHENPAPAFSAVERILRDYFPDSGTNMKIALVFMTLSEAKYKSILDTLNDQADMPSYINLKDQILTFFRRKQDAYEQAKQAAAVSDGSACS